MAGPVTVAVAPNALRRLLIRLRGDLRAAFSRGFLLLLVLLAITAPWIAPYSPTLQDINNGLAEPSAAHRLGTDDLGRDVFSHMVHGAAATLYASALAAGIAIVLGLPVALLAEASLRFLGLGIQPPNPRWGSMLARAHQNMETAPVQMFPPGLAILFTALAFNTLGEALRVALDPTMKR